VFGAKSDSNLGQDNDHYDIYFVSFLTVPRVGLNLLIPHHPQFIFHQNFLSSTVHIYQSIAQANSRRPFTTGWAGFVHLLGRAEFFVEKVVLGQIFPVSVIPPTFHIFV
jgi:hypothetical protein